MYMYGNTWSAFTTEPLNGCLRNMLSPRNSVGGDIVTRPFVGGWVSEWVRGWVGAYV